MFHLSLYTFISLGGFRSSGGLLFYLFYTHVIDSFYANHAALSGRWALALVSVPLSAS